METLYILLLKLYLKELKRLNIGYSPDEEALTLMYDIMNAIDYIKNGGATNTEILKIIAYYE